jgi:DNA-binding NarL/FixJ family response regulator
LFLSERTIERHIENLYRKLNVHNRAEAVEAARQLLLI